MAAITDISSKIAQYQQLPMDVKSAFGKTILASLNSAQKFWSEGERSAFWEEHEAVIGEIQKVSSEIADKKEELIDWRAGVSWPAYFYFQVHPEDKALDMVTKYVEGMQHPIADIVAFCQSIFKLPPEYKNYRATLQMLEQRLKGGKLIDFTANEWEQLFKAINASLGVNSGKKRTENSLVINTLKFYQCPKNADSFRQIDQYFAKQPAALKIWEEIRTRVFNFVYKNGSNVFKESEVAFLETHDLFHPSLCPTPEKLDPLMKEFCRELPHEMKKATDIFDLMAYVHQKLVHLHYFKDENGRTSRIAMGLLAFQAGVPPVLIESNRDYLYAVAQKDPKPLADLLRQLHASQTNTLESARDPTMNMTLEMVLQSTQ